MKLSSRALLGSRMAVEVRWGDGIMTGVCMLCCQTSLLLLLSSAREKPKCLFQTITHILVFIHFAQVSNAKLYCPGHAEFEENQNLGFCLVAMVKATH